MNCPRCSTLLVLLQEGKPAVSTIARDHFFHLWGCKNCDIIFQEGNFLKKRSKSERLKNLAFEANWPCYTTFTRYMAAKEAQQKGKMSKEDICVIHIYPGQEIYVPTTNKLVIGGLALSEGFKEEISGGKSIHRLHLDVYPYYGFSWEDLAPRQEELKRQFGNQRAHAILPDQNLPKLGQDIYLKSIYNWTTGNKELSCINYWRGGLARIINIDPIIKENGEASCMIRTKEYFRTWYEWRELKPIQPELMKKFGELRVGRWMEEKIKPEDRDKRCLELFGYVPKK